MERGITMRVTNKIKGTGIWKRGGNNEGTKGLKERKKGWEKYFDVKEREKKDDSNNSSADQVWGSCAGQRVEWNKVRKWNKLAGKKASFSAAVNGHE